MQRIDDIPQSSCWSMWEGCVCRHLKNHFGSHACDDRSCNTTWTTEQSEAWCVAEQEAYRNGGTVTDRHRSGLDS